MTGCLHIVLAMKPMGSGFAENVLRHGVGALNIEATRTETEDNLNGGAYCGGKRPTSAMGLTGEAGGASSVLEKGGGRLPPESFKQPSGRWPANIIHDGSPGVAEAFPVTMSRPHAGAQLSGKGTHEGWKRKAHEKDYPKWAPYDDSGSAARLFKQVDEFVLENE